VESPNSSDGSLAPIGGTDEFAAIDLLRSRFESAARSVHPEGALPPPGETWIGDDAAVLGLGPSDQLLWATDLVVEGIHVDLRLCGLDDVGYKALMVTVSDLAAMGARPRYALVSIAAPPGTDLDLLGIGLAGSAADSGCVVVGGDLSGSPVLTVSTSVVGTLGTGPDRPPLLRSGARPGHRLLVTGPLGASAAGLRHLRAGDRHPSDPATAALVRAHRRPQARLGEGEVSRLSGASAAIDISDGLASDARHLGRASGVGIALAEVPVADGATAEEAIGGGEEYELLVATPDPDALIRAYRRSGLRAPVAVGWCTGRPGEYTLDSAPLPQGGWHHRF
jgi:thiamine-monophosphate kinase